MSLEDPIQNFDPTPDSVFVIRFRSSLDRRSPSPAFSNIFRRLRRRSRSCRKLMACGGVAARPMTRGSSSSSVPSSSSSSILHGLSFWSASIFDATERRFFLVLVPLTPSDSSMSSAAKTTPHEASSSTSSSKAASDSLSSLVISS